MFPDGAGLLEPLSLVARIIALLIAISVHEYSHAYVADRLGDPTPREAGRLTLNPLKHLSLWGSLFLLFAGFGWSQPVPVNTYNFRNPRQGSLLTSLAGPLSNFVIAAIAAILFRVVPSGTYFPLLLGAIVQLNLVLMIFNLIPIPPLDGSSVLPFLFPQNAQLLVTLERQGTLILLGLILFDTVAGGQILGTIINRPVQVLTALLLGFG
jgi:Zn-dependent protease